MRKPIIYLADTDYRYLENLELLFAETLENRMELHVITDEHYFREQFGRPGCTVSADVALVGSVFYYEELCRHDIRKVIVLGEKDEDLDQSQKVLVINKYSNAKSILHEALHFLEAVSTGGARESGRAKLISVGSAIGGSGKTTIALALARLLSKHHSHVLYLNTEMNQSFSYFLKDKTELDTQVCRILREGPEKAYPLLRKYIRREGFEYIPPLPLPIDAFQISSDIYAPLAEKARDSGDYDYIVTDMDSGCDLANAKIMGKSDAVIIVVQPDPLSVVKTNFMLRNMDYSDEEKYIFICNKYDKTRGDAVSGQEAGRYQISGQVGLAADGLSLEAACEDTSIQDLSYLFL